MDVVHTWCMYTESHWSQEESSAELVKFDVLELLKDFDTVSYTIPFITWTAVCSLHCLFFWLLSVEQSDSELRNYCITLAS